MTVARYEKMFVWSEGQLKLLEPADIQSGDNVLDLKGLGFCPSEYLV